MAGQSRRLPFPRIVLGLLEQRGSVLDIGCGSSRIILDLPAAVGLDVLQRKLRWLRARGRHAVRATGERLPFPDHSFDAVICSEGIEHLPDRSAIQGEMDRVLRPGGILILGTPDYRRRLWWVLEWIYGKVLAGDVRRGAHHALHLRGTAGASRSRRLRDPRLPRCRGAVR
jgi:ubiquinone/menaquinone biosynthesis C-methylase UbiE